jgi:hypothetical protein
MVWYYYAVPAVLLHVKGEVCSIAPGQVIIVEGNEYWSTAVRLLGLALTNMYRAKLGIDSV